MSELIYTRIDLKSLSDIFRVIEIHQWVNETFGKSSDHPLRWWYVGNQIHFRDKADAALFLIFWADDVMARGTSRAWYAKFS